MKYITLFLSVLIFTIVIGSCNFTRNVPNETIAVKNIIPDSLKTESANKMIEILNAIRLTHRQDEEESENLITNAKESVFDIYATPVWGIRIGWGGFLPYDQCSQKQKEWIDEFKWEER